MEKIRRLLNPIRDYAWGSRTALAELTGRAAPTPGPEAELWMGAHPAAPSRVATSDGEVTLREWIARDAVAALGAGVAERFDGELPFLLKVLAAEAPLSLQTHPSARQARAGFDREEAAGVDRDAPTRSYRDPRAKPELVCALGPFDALCGFRPEGEIDAGLAALGAPAEAARAALGQGIGACFEALWRDVEARSALAHAAAAFAREGEGEDWALVRRLCQAYPGDIGVLAPLLLRRHRLDAGEALFLPAGQLHAYLGGVAVEVMANSDNVLRGGLTPKHVDVPELLAALDPSSEAPPRRRPEAQPNGTAVYPTPASAFELAVVRVHEGSPFDADAAHGVEIWLCVEGQARIRGPVAPGAERISRGEAVWVPAAAPPYGLEGAATFYRAGVPAAGR